MLILFSLYPCHYTILFIVIFGKVGQVFIMRRMWEDDIINEKLRKKYIL